MPGDVLVGAAVIGIEPLAGLHFLADLLPRDRMSAMGTLDQVARVGVGV